jgi:hypothetical protein
VSLHGRKWLGKKTKIKWHDNILVHLKEFAPCSNINGMLSVLLSTKELGGGMQKALTLIKCFRKQTWRVSF